MKKPTVIIRVEWPAKAEEALKAAARAAKVHHHEQDAKDLERMAKNAEAGTDLKIEAQRHPAMLARAIEWLADEPEYVDVLDEIRRQIIKDLQ